MYRLTRLPNGLTVATAEMPHMTSVCVGFWIGVGSRYEPPALNGICHFIEHMLFKGTRHRSPLEISQSIEGLGGYLNAFTSEENTCFYSRARHDRFADLLEVLVDMLLWPRLAPADVAKERGVIKEEVAMYLDQPAHHVQELLNAVQWPDHPLGRPITGTPESLDGINRTRLRRFLEAGYVAPATVIATAGRIEHRHVLRAVERIAPRFRVGPRLECVPFTPPAGGPRLRLTQKPIEQTQLALGIRTCSRHDEARHALRVLNVLLGENMSSRLFQIVREDRGLAYNIGSSISHFHDAGDIVISAGLDTANLPAVLRVIRRELRRFAQSPPSRGEFRRARDYVLGQLELSLESTENQMSWIGEQCLGYGRLEPPDVLKRRIARVTPSQIRAVADAVFRPERLTLALVSPLRSTRSLARSLF